MIKHISLYLGLIILIFSNQNGYCQKNFRPGYIITNNLDTVNGLINSGSNHLNSTKCEFKNGTKGETKVYSPFDINAYVITNSRYYVSRTIHLNGEEKQVFLEYLVNGIMDLYYYSEGFEEYYYIEKDSDLIQLDNNAEVVTDENGVKHVKYTNQYKGALKKLFGNVNELDEQLINARFEFKSLIKLTKDYHRIVCTNEACIDYTKIKRIDLSYEVGSGIDFSFMGLASSHDYAQDFQPIIGVNIRLKDNRYNSKIHLITGFNISKHSFEGSFRNTLVYKGYTKNHRVELNTTLLRIPVTLEYNFLSGKFHPTISLTYNNSFLLNPEYSVEILTYHSNGNYISNPVESPLRRYEYGIMAGLGFNYQINSNSYLSCGLNGEYRVPYVSLNLILDRLHFQSMIFNVSYGFKIKGKVGKGKEY